MICMMLYCRAFSTVVADTQFATLGVALITILARVARVVGPPDAPSKATDPTAIVKSQLASVVHKTSQWDPETMIRDESEDMGKVVKRKAIGRVSRLVDASHVEVPSKKISVEVLQDKPNISAACDHDAKVDEKKKNKSEQKVQKAESQNRAKKRKKGNAIDDLFDNLI